VEDYGVLRERYRQQAAEALRELSFRQEMSERLRAEFEVAVAPPASRTPPSDAAGHVGPLEQVSPNGSTPGRKPAGGATPSRHSRPVHLALLLGGLATVLAVAGVVALYTRAGESQMAQAPLSLLAIDHAHAITFEPSGGIWVAHHGGLLRSADGRSWNPGPPGDVMAAVQLGQRWLLFGHDVLLDSQDGGRTWSPLQHDLPGTDVHGADRGSSGAYAYVVGAGLFRSEDGERWVQVGRPLAREVAALAVLPGGEGGEWIVVAAGGTVLRSADGGLTWSAAGGAAGGALGGTVRAIAADREQRLLYAASSEGLYRSANGGADWVRLPYRGSAAAVGVGGGRLALVDDEGHFYLSTNGGASWVTDF
jgi:photosystem II stability/assembly factor-like uncharacterized protein